MTNGAIIFASSSSNIDYEIAVLTAKRINHFLQLPVTLLTDSILLKDSSMFDQVHVVDGREWRYQAYEKTSYDKTLLLDLTYMVNSNQLLKTFDFMDDFCFFDKATYLMQPTAPVDELSTYSYKTAWATVIAFKKSKRVEEIFQCLQMIEQNYEHYSNLHKFTSEYNSDFAMTLAAKIANGYLTPKQDLISWNLLRINNALTVKQNTNELFNTEFTITKVKDIAKSRYEYIVVRDCDFYMLSKDNYMELVR